VAPFRYELTDPSPYNYPLESEPRGVQEKALSDTFLVGKKAPVAAKTETNEGYPIRMVIRRMVNEASSSLFIISFSCCLTNSFFKNKHRCYVVLDGENNSLGTRKPQWTLSSSPGMMACLLV